MPCVPCKEEICSGSAIGGIESLHTLYRSGEMPKELRNEWVEFIVEEEERIAEFKHRVMNS